MAARLTEEGAKAVAADLNEEAVAATAEHPGVDFEVVDASSGTGNNDAISIPGDVTDVSVEDFDRTIAVNLRGVLGCKFALPALLEAGDGLTVNTPGR